MKLITSLLSSVVKRELQIKYKIRKPQSIYNCIIYKNGIRRFVAKPQTVCSTYVVDFSETYQFMHT